MLGNIFRHRISIPGVLLTLFCLTRGLYAQDIRTTPLDVNLIIDGSSALKNAGGEAITWVSDYLVDKILQTGDRVTLWDTAEKARVIYSDTLTETEGKENIKKILGSLNFQGASADFSGALKDAARRMGGSSSRPAMTYTILISGSSSALSPLLLGADAKLLRYSRVEDFSGWRALIIALDIDARVQQAAAAYFSGR